MQSYLVYNCIHLVLFSVITKGNKENFEGFWIVKILRYTDYCNSLTIKMIFFLWFDIIPYCRSRNGPISLESKGSPCALYEEHTRDSYLMHIHRWPFLFLCTTWHCNLSHSLVLPVMALNMISVAAWKPTITNKFCISLYNIT